MKVLVPYPPGSRWVNAVLAWWWREAETEPLVVLPVPCVDDGDYERAFRSVWNTETALWISEHDILPTRVAYRALRDCPEPLCAVEYPVRLFPWLARDDRNRPVSQDVRWATAVGFGLVRFKPALMGMFSLDGLEAGTWRDLDSRFYRLYARRFGPGRVHVHWEPVTHLSVARQEATAHE